MNILVINEPFTKDFCRTQRWAARTRGRVMRPPDWLAYITAVLEKYNHNVRLFDFPANNLERDDFINLIRKRKPEAVILDSTTPSIYSDIEYARICKEEANSKVVFVGPHATALPEETLKDADGVIDFIVRGEPEATIRDLFAALSRNEPVDFISGLTYFKQGNIFSNPDRQLISNLDQLPFPAWHHLNLKKYFDGIKLFPFIDIIGGRGCPYQCSFCLWPQVMHGNSYRLRSPENIVSEMVYDIHLWPWILKGEFFFEDDTFTVQPKRAINICKEILKLPVPVTWSVNARADHGNSEMFQMMKKAGARMLLIGYESGNQDILNKTSKRLKLSKAISTAELASKAGLKLHGCFVLGLPGETKESMEETIRYALELPLDTVQFSAAVPFPGTKYYDYCRENGLLRAKRWNEWLSEGEQSCVVDYPNLSCQEITTKVDEALRRFYFRPNYMRRFLLDTHSARDLYRKLRGAGNFAAYLLKKLYQ